MLNWRVQSASFAFLGSLLTAQPVQIPFVGCESGGQISLDAPKGTSFSARISPKLAQAFAYYDLEKGFGVLAPRGWHCFGTYGSSVHTLIVAREPIGVSTRGSRGPTVRIMHISGEGGGITHVAEIIARVFPAYRSFADGVRKSFPEITLPSAPYPKDTLEYKGTNTVEYVTPARTDGLGTFLGLEKGDDQIVGVALLAGKSPDVFLLSVRLSPDQVELTSAIIREFEAAEHRPL